MSLDEIIAQHCEGTIRLSHAVRNPSQLPEQTLMHESCLELAIVLDPHPHPHDLNMLKCFISGLFNKCSDAM
jgi:hypothetical protein